MSNYDYFYRQYLCFLNSYGTILLPLTSYLSLLKYLFSLKYQSFTSS